MISVHSLSQSILHGCYSSRELCLIEHHVSPQSTQQMIVGLYSKIVYTRFSVCDLSLNNLLPGQYATFYSTSRLTRSSSFPSILSEQKQQDWFNLSVFLLFGIVLCWSKFAIPRLLQGWICGGSGG